MSANTQEHNMANDKYKQLGEDFFADIWGKRERGIPIPEIQWGPIRHQDVEYLLNQYPFLQIISTEPNFPEEITPQLITANSGWTIHDYGDAMSTSPGEWLFGYFEKNEEEEGGKSGGTIAGKGTIVNQAYLTAQQMVAIAMEKGWPGIEIVAGNPLMCWAAWMLAQDYNFPLQGYEPTRVEKRKRERIKSAAPTTEILTRTTGPRK